jgi:hypothetical protein
MANHNRAVDAEAPEGLSKNRRLSLGCPEPIAWAFAVAVAGSIKGQHSLPLRDQPKNTAGDVILSLNSIAVQQHDWRITITCFQVVQPNPVNIHETAGWRMGPLSPLRIRADLKGNSGQDSA